MEFSDLASLGGSPAKSSTSKKRGASNNSSRLRLMPIDGASYDVTNHSNNNNNNSTAMAPASNNNNSSSSSPMMALASSKLKKITQKKDLLEAVRKANAPIVLPLREPLGGGGRGAAGSGSVLRRDSSSSSLPSSGAVEEEEGASQAAKDIESLEDGVRLNARKYNDHKLLADRRQRELSTLLDELRTLQLETQALRSMQNHETPIARQSQRLRDEIQSCTATMEEQMHVRRQLDHMMRRLQTGQLKVDAHLEAMAKAVEASQREADEVKLLCRQLEAGKSRAVQFLQDVNLQLQLDRRNRARELNDTEIRAKNAQKMEAWRLQRMAERAEIAAELRGDLSAEEEQRLLRCIESRERANEALHVANQTKSQKAADYEDVLAQLKMAMGATSLGEVVEKIQAQAMTSVSLDKEKGVGEARLLSVRQEKEHALQSLNELKASGIGGIELNREVYNTLEHEILQAKATLKVNKAAYERLDGVIQGVRQGSFGLAQRLQGFDDVLDLSSSASSSSNLGESGGGGGGGLAGLMAGTALRLDNSDCLAIAELKLTKILELIGQQGSSGGGGGSGGFGGGFGSEEGSDESGASSGGFDDLSSSRGADFVDDRHALWSPTANNDPVLHKNNIRVPAGRRGNVMVDAEEMAEGSGGFYSGPALPPAPDSARSDVSTESDSGHHVMDVHVPSRDILKMSSARHFAEVVRKKEMAEKQKAAAERGISDEEMLSKQRKKNQLEADARLATSPQKAKHLLPGADAASYAFVTQLHFSDLS